MYIKESEDAAPSTVSATAEVDAMYLSPNHFPKDVYIYAVPGTNVNTTSRVSCPLIPERPYKEFVIGRVTSTSEPIVLMVKGRMGVYQLEELIKGAIRELQTRGPLALNYFSDFGDANILKNKAVSGATHRHGLRLVGEEVSAFFDLFDHLLTIQTGRSNFVVLNFSFGQKTRLGDWKNDIETYQERLRARYPYLSHGKPLIDFTVELKALDKRFLIVMDSIPDFGFPVTREDISLGQGFLKNIRYAFDKIKVQLYFRTKEITQHPHSGDTIALKTDLTENVSDLSELILGEWVTDAVEKSLNDPNFEMPLRIEIKGVSLEEGYDIMDNIFHEVLRHIHVVPREDIASSFKMSAKSLLMGMGLAVAQSIKKKDISQEEQSSAELCRWLFNQVLQFNNREEVRCSLVDSICGPLKRMKNSSFPSVKTVKAGVNGLPVVVVQGMEDMFFSENNKLMGVPTHKSSRVSQIVSRVVALREGRGNWAVAKSVVAPVVKHLENLKKKKIANSVVDIEELREGFEEIAEKYSDGRRHAIQEMTATIVALSCVYRNRKVEYESVLMTGYIMANVKAITIPSAHGLQGNKTPTVIRHGPALLETIPKFPVLEFGRQNIVELPSQDINLKPVDEVLDLMERCLLSREQYLRVNCRCQGTCSGRFCKCHRYGEYCSEFCSCGENCNNQETIDEEGEEYGEEYVEEYVEEDYGKQFLVHY